MQGNFSCNLLCSSAFERCKTGHYLFSLQFAKLNVFFAYQKFFTCYHHSRLEWHCKLQERLHHHVTCFWLFNKIVDSWITCVIVLLCYLTYNKRYELYTLLIQNCRFYIYRNQYCNPESSEKTPVI